jgi:hypothetical protein
MPNPPFHNARVGSNRGSLPPLREAARAAAGAAQGAAASLVAAVVTQGSANKTTSSPLETSRADREAGVEVVVEEEEEEGAVRGTVPRASLARTLAGVAG